MRSLTVVTYLFGFLGAATAVLVGAGFSESQRLQYHILEIAHQERPQLIIITVVFFALAYGANLSKDLLARPEVTATDEHSVTHRATVTGFREELRHGAERAAAEAEDYFKAGERDFAEARYADAAQNYHKSLSVLPTASAYLNLGVSLFRVSALAKAEEALGAGLRLTRDHKNRVGEAAALGN